MEKSDDSSSPAERLAFDLESDLVFNHLVEYKTDDAIENTLASTEKLDHLEKLLERDDIFVAKMKDDQAYAEYLVHGMLEGRENTEDDEEKTFRIESALKNRVMFCRHQMLRALAYIPNIPSSVVPFQEKQQIVKQVFLLWNESLGLALQWESEPMRELFDVQ